MTNNWKILKASIANIIKENNNQEITGVALQNVLNSIISSVGENAMFAGVANAATSPGVPDGPVFYLATDEGLYSNFGGLNVKSGLSVIHNINEVWEASEILNLDILLKDVGPKVVGDIKVEELNTFFENDFINIATSNNQPCIFKVKHGNATIGLLEVFSDSALHVITQILTTSHTIKNNTVSKDHFDEEVFTYTRTLARSSMTWTRWVKIADSNLRKKIFTEFGESVYGGGYSFNYFKSLSIALGSFSNTFVINWDNSYYAISICNSNEDAALLKVPVGLTRYFKSDVSKGDIPLDVVRPQSLFDAEGQYEMRNYSKDKLLKISSDGELIRTKFYGKNICFIGDSIMTGYPNSKGDGDDLATIAHGYPFIIEKRQEANVKLIALPNAIARTSNINGEVPEARKDRILMNSIAQATYLNSGSSNLDTAIKFSYESELTKYIDRTDLFVIGLGVNDVDMDVDRSVSPRKWLEGSEFVEDSNVPIDTRDTKFYTGAINSLIDYIYSKKINAKVCILGHYTYSDAQFYPLNLNERLIARQKQICEYWSIPFISPAEHLGWNFHGNNTTSRLMHFCPDEIHPTDAAGKLDLAKAVEIELLNKIIL